MQTHLLVRSKGWSFCDANNGALRLCGSGVDGVLLYQQDTVFAYERVVIPVFAYILYSVWEK